MSSSSSRLRILSVGGNAVSAFLSWRLQATNACDVTLVWKSGFENVSQYGISFKSKVYGNERFKPRAVVRSPDEAAGPPGFDYVLLCVKALPDVYDLAAVIESVVTPQLTCIIVNTTNALGIESYLETRFPTNVVLSLCSGVSINQLGASDFEHLDSSEIWVGSANQNPNIPSSVQGDMAEALALTLQSGNVDCHVSSNIRQQQWEKMIGPIAFHPISVLAETPELATLYEMTGMRDLIDGLIDELLSIATRQECNFPPSFKRQTIDAMLRTTAQSTMYQDYLSRRPMEVEILLGSPIKMATTLSLPAPRLQSLYPLLHHLNVINQTKQTSNINFPPQNRALSGNDTITNGNTNGFKSPPATQGEQNVRLAGPRPVFPTKRGPSSLNGRPLPNGNLPRHSVGGPNGSFVSRRNSFENDLEEFGHIAMYGDLLHTDDTDDLVLASSDDRNLTHGDNSARQSLSIRERELQLRQRELALKEQELALQRGRGGGNRRKSSRQNTYDFEDDDEDDDEDYFGQGGTQTSHVNPDNIDMMSVTSRRNRRLPSGNSLRGNLDRAGGLPHRISYQGAPIQSKGRARDRTSDTLIGDFPTPHSSIVDDPLMNYSTNRYPTLPSSRANSLTTQRIDDFSNNAHNQSGHTSIAARRSSANAPYHSPYPPNGPRIDGPGGPKIPQSRPIFK